MMNTEIVGVPVNNDFVTPAYWPTHPWHLTSLQGTTEQIQVSFQSDRLDRLVPSSWHTKTAAATAATQGKHNTLWHTELTRRLRASMRQ